MSGRYRLKKANRRLHQSKQDEIIYIPGELGLKIHGEKQVEVPRRPGYVWVRIRNDLSEVVMAFNDKVSAVYGLPVLIVRDRVDKGKYYVVGRDTGRYNNWGSSPYLPIHGDTHSYDPWNPGIDPVWVWNRQIMPLMAIPSGSGAGMNLIIEPGSLYQGGRWMYAGMTGTPDLTPYKPAGNTASMVLVYIDNNGNPQLQGGSSFSALLTGTYDVYPYIPPMPGDGLCPIAAVRLLSGSSVVSWDNLYDLRQLFANGLVTGSFSAVGHTIQDDGVTQTQRDFLNFVGDGFVLYDDGTKTIVSGTASGSGSPTVTASRMVISNSAGAMSVNDYAQWSALQSNPTYPSFTIGAGTGFNSYVDNSLLNLVVNNLSSIYGMGLWGYTEPPTMAFFASQGSIASPSWLLDGNQLMRLIFYGKTAQFLNPQYAGELTIEAVEPFSSGSAHVGTQLRFQNYAENSADLVDAMNIYAGLAMFHDDLQISVTGAYYLGDRNTNGSLRVIENGGTLQFQKRLGGVWTATGAGTTGTSTMLNDLLDVNAPSPTQGQTIAFNTGTALWEASGGIKSRWYLFSEAYDSQTGNFRIVTSGTGATIRHVVFCIPDDFGTLVQLSVMVLPTVDSTTQNYSILGDYAAPGEAYTTHYASGTTGALTLTSNQITKVNISALFGSLAAGDVAGLSITKKVNEGVGYLGLLLEYI